MGAALSRAGIDDFIIFEQGDSVGGIWRDNTYPGCSCDVPAQLYSYSFHQFRSAETRFPGQATTLAYLTGLADRYRLHPRIRLGTAITSATYNDLTGSWTLTTSSGDTHTATIIVCAIGQLHRPYIPPVPGQDVFTGSAFHSARWDHARDLTGRDVAVIGTGASAAQLIPSVARVARHVDVYQRTPNWVLPKPAPHFGPVTGAILRLPGAQSVYRTLIYLGADVTLTGIITRGWSARPAEWLARVHLHHRVADPALRAKLTPQSPIGCKRPILDNGYYAALCRDNVELVTATIDHLTADAVHTDDGVDRRADTIIWATGFRSADFLLPLDVHGRDGISLTDEWAEGPEAYLGTAMPGFPNLFMLHGPNSFSATNSNIAIKEGQFRLILRCIRLLASWDAATAIEVRPEALRRYRRTLDASLAKTVWHDCHSWYRDPGGRLVNPWPGSARSFRRYTRRNPRKAFRPVLPRTQEASMSASSDVADQPFSAEVDV